MKDFSGLLVQGICLVRKHFDPLVHVQGIPGCDVLAVPAYDKGGAPVYQHADLKVFGLEGASGHDVVAVPACVVEGVPEHDAQLNEDCICHLAVAVAAMPKGDLHTRHTLSMGTDMKHYSDNGLELQSETVNDGHDTDEWLDVPR